MLPLDIASFGQSINYTTFFAIGFGFGTVLELAGFGNARKLAAQFYLKDMTVLKTMFSGILTACLLIFLSASLGYLDFSKIFVNQTYLWPGIVGGTVMGVGFVIGGYCPGTSVVSAASFKLDGMVFFAGTLLGAGVFGESVDHFSGFWNASYTERLLLSDWFGWSIGATVFAVTLLALGFFYGAEKIEQHFRQPTQPFSWRIGNRAYVASAGVAVAVALGIWIHGQPTPEQKWQQIGADYQPLLDQRDVFVHPLEYVKTWNDSAVKLVTLDLRPKAAFDAFHLDAAERVTFEQLADQDFVFALDQLPPQGVVVLVADNEADAIRAWKRLKVQGVTNLYILEHGLRDWKSLFASVAALHFDLAKPPAKVLEQFPKDAFKTKIKLKTSHRAGGLCS
jgi:rhodanese-related sulfurtransferase